MIKRSLLALGLISVILAAALLPANALADGSFVDSRIVTGLNMPTSMDFSPDGRLFVTEKAGSLRIIKDGALVATPFMTINVDSVGERGLLGMAFDPNFASNGFIYVYYTATTPETHNRVSRFTSDPGNPDRVLTGSELPLLDLDALGPAWHNGGAVHFGNDGKLYVATGDNGNSTNSQSLSTRLGKILRINSDGSIPSDNPFYNVAGAKKEIWALGLRNPFTFAFSHSNITTSSSSLSSSGAQMYINDVGQDVWEEINMGSSGANYAWPLCEGSCSDTRFANPVYAYNHNGAGACISGAAFYESTQFPSEYRGSYFFGDYVQGFIKRLTPTNQVVDFLSGLNSPVDIKIGPDGSLYYLSIGAGEVHKVQYIPGANHNPVAVISANPTSGAPAPLTVNFDGSGSSDPDLGDVLSYSWTFGDGTSSSAGTGATHTYNSPGVFVATLTVTDGKGGSDSASINISVGSPPSGVINQPLQGTKYDAGNVIFFSGSGSDTEDGQLPASAFKWVILLHHNTHTHPFMEFDGVKSGNFTIPTLSETDSDVWYRIYLIVTDSTGLSQTTTRDVIPNKVNVMLTTNVSSQQPGLQISLDGQPKVTPYSFTGVVGIVRTLDAPAQQLLNGATWKFQSWSDGGAASHTISTPSTNATYIASYSLLPSALTVQSKDMSGSPVAGYWTVLQTSNGTNTLATGFTPATFTLTNGQQYLVTVSGYGDYQFDHWLDNGSTVNSRLVSINSDTQLTAVYSNTSTPPSPGGPSTLTIDSQKMDGSPVAGYWTVLQTSNGTNTLATGFTPATFTLTNGQQYLVTVSGYGDYQFDHWLDNGMANPSRTVAISQNTRMVATYSQITGDLRISTQLGNGTTLAGLSIKVDGVGTSQSPATFTLHYGQSYNVTVPDTFGNYRFDHWADNNSTSSSRTFIMGVAGSSSSGIYSLVAIYSPETYQLNVGTQRSNGQIVSGLWTTLSQNGQVVATGFSPASFTLRAGEQYTVNVSNYQNYVFDHWADTNSTSASRALTLTQGLTLNAIYRSPSITISPATGVAGTSINVAGNYFAANSAVTIQYDGTPVQTVPATITSSSAGAFSASFSVPSFSITGTHTVRASTSGVNSVATATTFTDTSSPTRNLTISTQFGNGTAFSGLNVVVSGVGTSQSPATFTLHYGQSYNVTVPDTFGNYRFDHWADGGVTTTSRTVLLNSDLVEAAVYIPSTHPLSVSTQYANGTELGLTVSVGQISMKSPAVFTLNDGQMYNLSVPSTQSSTNAMFDHWLDSGSTSQTRNVVLPQDPSNVIAIYRPPPDSTTLTLGNIQSVPWGKDMTIGGRLTDSQKGTALGGVTISFTGNGTSGLVSKTVVTNADGSFTLSGASPPTASSNWIVQAHYAGSTTAYKPSDSIVQSFSTLKHQVSLTLSLLPSSSSIPWGSSLSFVSTAKDSTNGGAAVLGIPIHFDGSGAINVADRTTNSTGVAAGSGFAPNNVATGLTAKAHFIGNANYYAADSTAASYSTIRHGTSLTLQISPSTVSRGASYSVNGVLTDTVTNSNISSKVITFTATSPIVISSSTTSTTGSYIVSGLKAPTRIATYQITASFGGDALYLTSNSPSRTLAVIR